MTGSATMPDMTDTRACSICGSTADVKHYGLRDQRRTATGPTSIGAGGIKLCHACWRKHAEPSMRRSTR